MRTLEAVGLVASLPLRASRLYCWAVGCVCARCCDLGWGVASYSWPWTLLIYLLTAPFAEVFFYLHSQRYLRLSSERSHRTFVADTDSAEAERALFRLFGELSGPELQQMLRGWFLGSGEMQRENMRELFAWIVCNSRVDELKPTRVARIDALVEHVEEAIGKAFPPGRNEGLRAMTYTLEALEPTAHKPLAFYLALQSAHKLFGAGLSCLGFRLRREGALRYWHRPAITCFRRPLPPTPPPLVLMHGVGGLLPYALLIAQLTRTWRGAILIPAFPSCAMACMPRTVFADETLPPTELSAALVAMVRRHAPQRAPEGSDGTDGTDGSDGSDGSVPPPRAAFLAHSLGSAHLAALLKASPDVAAAVAFIDPICFQLMCAAPRCGRLRQDEPPGMLPACRTSFPPPTPAPKTHSHALLPATLLPATLLPQVPPRPLQLSLREPVAQPGQLLPLGAAQARHRRADHPELLPPRFLVVALLVTAYTSQPVPVTLSPLRVRSIGACARDRHPRRILF